MNDFLVRVAAILEVPSVTPETRFREVPDWCSLMAFGLLVMLENECHVRLTVDDFRKLATVADLAAAAGVGSSSTFFAFVAEVLGVPAAELTPATAYNSIPEWDSVMHLRLVMEFERRYGVSVPLEKVPALRTLADFQAMLRA